MNTPATNRYKHHRFPAAIIGNVRALRVQRRREKIAAKQCFRTRLNGCQYVPRVIVTAKLKRYRAAMREILPEVEHRQHRALHHRAEDSHQPPRPRQRRLQGFKSPRPARRFLAVYGPMAQHFRRRRHRFSASDSRQAMRHRFATWQDLTTLPTTAYESRPEAVMLLLPGCSC